MCIRCGIFASLLRVMCNQCLRGIVFLCKHEVRDACTESALELGAVNLQRTCKYSFGVLSEAEQSLLGSHLPDHILKLLLASCLTRYSVGRSAAAFSFDRSRTGDLSFVSFMLPYLQVRRSMQYALYSTLYLISVRVISP